MIYVYLVEGVDGSGKSTNAQNTMLKLIKQKKKVIYYNWSKDDDVSHANYHSSMAGSINAQNGDEDLFIIWDRGPLSTSVYENVDIKTFTDVFRYGQNKVRVVVNLFQLNWEWFMDRRPEDDDPNTVDMTPEKMLKDSIKFTKNFAELMRDSLCWDSTRVGYHFTLQGINFDLLDFIKIAEDNDLWLN